MGAGGGNTEPSEAQRALAWDSWLNGDSLARIHRYDLEDLTPAKIRDILEGDPPETIRQDLRYRLGGRFFYLMASGVRGAADGGEQPFVVVMQPRKVGAVAFRSAIRAIRRDVRGLGPGAGLNLHIVEGLEADVAVRFVNERGYRGYRLDETGAVERVERFDAPEPEPEPAGPRR